MEGHLQMNPQRLASHRAGGDGTGTPSGPPAAERPIAAGRLAEELGVQLGAGYDPDAVRAAIADAARELRGSINPNALPEMAYRLAHYRLTGFQPRWSAPRGGLRRRRTTPRAPTRAASCRFGIEL